MQELIPGYVLHTRPWKETSVMVDLWSEKGRTVAIAKGAKRPTSQWRGLLHPLQPLLLRWSGRGDVHTLTAVEPVTHGAAPLESTLSYCGIYANELLIRTMLPGAAYPELFAHYSDLLQGLQEIGDNLAIDAMEMQLRRFELRLLDALGYAIDFQCCSAGQQIEADSYYRFVKNTGFCQSKAETNGVFAGDQLLALGRLQFDSLKTRSEAKRLLRMALEPVLGESPIFSRGLFQSVKEKGR